MPTYLVYIPCDYPFYIYEVEATNKKHALELAIQDCKNPDKRNYEFVEAEGFPCFDKAYAVEP